MYLVDNKGVRNLLMLLSKYDGIYKKIYEDSISGNWSNSNSLDHQMFFINLSEAVTSEEDTYNLDSFNGEYAKDCYMNLNLPKSDAYMHHLNYFIELMNKSGYSSYWEYDYYEIPSNKSEFSEMAWEKNGTTYELLRETGDYWWFLVAFSQVYSSWLYMSFGELNRFLHSVNQKGMKGFSEDWFVPLKTFYAREEIRVEFENSKNKSFDKSTLKNVDFSTLNSVNVNYIPEYDLDDYVENEGNFYDPFDVYLAITASGGFAQSLERQDLEGSVENIGKMIKKRKKKVKR